MIDLPHLREYMPCATEAARPIAVVGGGPAGLAAAIAFRQSGFEVDLYDHAEPPQDKTCGEGLLPASLAALGQLGIEIPPDWGFRFRGIRFSDSHRSVSADFPNGPALGLRRPLLHRLLVARAAQLEVKLHWGAKQLPSLDRRFVVAADGADSRLRRERGLEPVALPSRRWGFRQHFQLAPWSSFMELYWGPNCQLYVTPVASDEVCVVAMSRDSRMRLSKALPLFPEVQRRLVGAAACSRESGSPSTSRRLRRVLVPNFALIGDASGSVDAITGEGLALAFQQALALAQGLQHGDLPHYAAEHARLNRRPHQMSRLLLLLDRFAALRKVVLAALSAQPSLFALLLSIHVGETFQHAPVFAPPVLE